MNAKNCNTYISYKLVKHGTLLLSLISFFALICMDYDVEYKCVALLPIVYYISELVFLKRFMLKGIGVVALVCAYAFRMCILPVLCAYGNFYLEPSKSIYISYFWLSVILTCVECLIVFASLSYYSSKCEQRIKYSQKREMSGTNNSILILFGIIAIIIYIFTFAANNGFLSSHYHFLIFSSETAALFEIENAKLQGLGAKYYLVILLDITARPILSFVFVNWGLRRNTKVGMLLAIGIGLFNVLWVSDRRILSLLIGACCLLQVLLHIRGRISKSIIYWIIFIMGILTVVYCFWGEDTPTRIARKFQRYFSGPTLTAIGLAVFDKYVQTPLTFVKLLFNDSVFLTGMFTTFSLPDYVGELCGAAGYSIWTPMFIGAIQYFYIFSPLLIVGAVKFIVYTDYKSRVYTSDLEKMMMNYLAIAVSVYMIMYSLELVYYNIIFIGGFYYLLLFANSRISFVRLRHRRINIDGKREEYLGTDISC